jgi:16S rRNA (uracil1498-N3)-methyltransferase
VLKGEKMDDIVRDAVMLGVAAVQPLVTSRAETTVAALSRGARLDRWRRVALASVKQSRRAVLPDIRRPLTLESFLQDPHAALTLMLVEPGAPGVDAVEPLTAFQKAPTPQDATIFVGPEGGWNEAEIGQARQADVRLVTLGRRTLRADATPIAAISVLQYIWGDL